MENKIFVFSCEEISYIFIKIIKKKEIILNSAHNILKIHDYVIHPELNNYREKIILREVIN